MQKILSIISSINGAKSYSNRLADAVIARIQETYPDNTVQVRDLTKNTYPHLEESHLQAFFAPPEMSGNFGEAMRHSDEAIGELNDADIIVMAVPMYNFGIPSVLKTWIDHTVRINKTFVYDEQGIPKGIFKNKKVYLAIASGGIYSDGPMKAFDFTESYLRSILGFIGLTDMTAFRVEGTAIPGVQDTALQKGIESISI